MYFYRLDPSSLLPFSLCPLELSCRRPRTGRLEPCGLVFKVWGLKLRTKLGWLITLLKDLSRGFLVILFLDGISSLKSFRTFLIKEFCFLSFAAPFHLNSFSKIFQIVCLHFYSDWAPSPHQSNSMAQSQQLSSSALSSVSQPS